MLLGMFQISDMNIVQVCEDHQGKGLVVVLCSSLFILRFSAMPIRCSKLGFRIGFHYLEDEEELGLLLGSSNCCTWR
ncbi:unnamed protein product [Camellia sinensis]